MRAQEGPNIGLLRPDLRTRLYRLARGLPPRHACIYSDGMALLDRSRLEEFLVSHPGWVLDGDTITRTFTLSNFARAVGFVVSVGIIAEKANHHPDMDIRYRRVTVSLTTHDHGGVTLKDISLARHIDKLGSAG